LGYSASGSFVRAFLRWHGETPGSWRGHKPAIGRAATPARVSNRRH
jgi:AraC-like DNA-binding protein